MGHIAGIASAIIGSLSSVISLIIGTGIGQAYNNTLIPITCGFLVLSCLAYLTMCIADAKSTTNNH